MCPAAHTVQVRVTTYTSQLESDNELQDVSLQGCGVDSCWAISSHAWHSWSQGLEPEDTGFQQPS